MAKKPFSLPDNSMEIKEPAFAEGEVLTGKEDFLKKKFQKPKNRIADTSSSKTKKSKRKSERAALPVESTNENTIKAYSYDLAQRHSVDKKTGFVTIQTNPSIIIGVVRIKYPDTWDYSKKNSAHPFKTPATDNSYPVAVRKGDDGSFVLQIQNSCIVARVISSKNSHTTSFSGTFVDPTNQLMKKILPGDWICVWMFDNKEDATRVSNNIAQQKQANGFLDGLKFVGKANSIRKNINIDVNGKKTRRVTVSANGFGEFDENIWYDPILVTKIDQDKFGESVLGDPNLFSNENILRDINLAIPTFLSILLGRGPQNTQLTAGKLKSPNSSFIIPSVIGQLLGVNKASSGGGQLRYVDILNPMVGSHNYNKPTADNYLGFHPKLHPLKGILFYQLTPWQNVPIWSIIKSFSNPAINEMYNTLRVDEKGNVMPSFIARQIPFTTNAFKKSEPRYFTTPFLSLPRWKVNPGQVLSLNVGRSDALRVNVCQIIVQTGLNNLDTEFLQIQRAGQNFIYDLADIKRNGMRGRFEVVNCDAGDINANDDSGFIWTKFKADTLFNGHLKYSGTIIMKGIQEPIAIGDNLEFDDNVYHIEQISHIFTKTPEGTSQFNTEIQLSNGVYKDADITYELWPELEVQPENNEDTVNFVGNLDTE